MKVMASRNHTNSALEVSLQATQRFLVCAVAIVIVGAGVMAPFSAQAQTPGSGPPGNVLPDFDVRTLRALTPGAPPAPSRALSQRDTGRAAAVAAGWPAAKFTLGFDGFLRTLSAEGAPLSAPSERDPVDVSRQFLSAHQPVFGLTNQETQNLRLTARTSDHGTVLIHFLQTVNGVPVYNGHINLVLNLAGQIKKVNLGDILRGATLDSNPVLSPEEAVHAALRMSGFDAPAALVAMEPDAQGRPFFENPLGAGHTPIRVELTAFPVGASEARLAYRIFLEAGEANWFELLVDAQNGYLLFRHNLYRSVAQGRVWKISPLMGPRELVNFPEGWLVAGQTRTTGNNIDAYLDTDLDNLPDQTARPNIQNGRAVSPNQVFDFPAGEGSTGQNPREFPAGAVTNLFYFANEAHDYFYGLGFDEAAGNFQSDNFGRGGAGNDAVRVEAQNGLNTAGFATTPDGIPPRAQFGLFDLQRTPQQTDDRDASYEAQVVVHELGHGFTTRVVGGPDMVSCLNGIQSAALGEGWSDYLASSYTNDPVQGGYLAANAEHGVRRYSYEGYPLTYEAFGNTGSVSPHDDGEIWAGTLWDIRKSLGKQTADQLVARALKLTSCAPSMIDARDAVIQADTNAGAANRAKLWEVFARHGMGDSAMGVDGDNILTGTVFTAAFDRPPDLQPGNRFPKVTSQPDLAVGVGQPYQYSIAATDADGDPLTYSVSEGPPGLTVNATGRVSWTATFTGQRAKVAVADGKGGQAVHGFYIPVLTVLFSNEAVKIGGSEGSFGFGGIIVPTGSPVLQFTLRGGSGDPDLLVIGPDGSVGGFARQGSTETFSVASPAAGPWLVRVTGLETYTDVSLKAQLLVPTVIEKNTTLRNRVGDRTSETFYRVTVPEGVSALRIAASGGTGDADLFVRRGAVPVCQDLLLIFSGGCEFDELSIEQGNDEVIEIANPEPGEWYIDVVGFAAYSGVSLTVEFPQPTIKNGGVVLSTQTPNVTQAPARSIISVFGDGFAPAGALVVNPELDAENKVSTTLANTCLEINGNRSPMFAVLPTQVNAQISEKVMPGPASAVVIRGCGTPAETRSAPVGFVVSEVAPAFFNFTNQVSGVNPIAAVHGGGPALVGAPGLIPGATFTEAEPNGIVSFFGTGFGSTTPALVAGVIPSLAVPDGVARSTGPSSVTVGGIAVPAEDIFYVGAAPCCAGLDQLVIRVPANAPNGNLPVQLTIGGVSSPQGPYITVKKP
jgi:uncharacterized protein (TIGR03437 family)